MRYQTNEDLNGYVRGAHQDGEDVCAQYEFHLPGSSSTSEKVVWGWNDVAAFNCAKCKMPATEHVVIKAPELREPPKPPKPAVYLQPNAPPPAIDPTAADPSVASELRRQREAEQAAYFNAGYDRSGMLDADNDPLAMAARPKQPPPRQPPAMMDVTMPPPLATAGSAPPAQFTSRGADLAEGVQDAALQELLSRDANANEAFKREVERMVREANRQTELDTHGVVPAPAAAPVRSGVVDSRDLTGCTVPLGSFADAGSLLSAVSLPQYESVFREEAMEPDTLIEVLQQQGKAALEGALKELGIKSMGHRLKITNALIVQ